MSTSEKGLVEAAILAINEINENGGILGRKIQPIIKDGKTDLNVLARIAEQLIVEDEVAVVFGCWTSNCRKSVLPVFEKYDHLLYYSLPYEGIEQSKYIIYLVQLPIKKLYQPLNGL